MKPSILVVMLDFLVCSLLMFVVGDTSAPPMPAGGPTQAEASGPVHEAYGTAAVEAMRAEWNQDYEQQILLAQLNSQRAENRQLQSSLASTSAQLSETSASLSAKQAEAQALQELTAQREQSIRELDANLKQLAEQKARETQQLQALNAEREQQIQQLDASVKQIAEQKQQAEQALASTKTEVERLAVERTKLQQEQAALEQRTQQLAKTINSQQDTIRTLTENVSAGQSRLEGQIARFAEDQRRMGDSLSKLEEWSRSLPDVIRENTAGINKDQETLMANIAALTDRVAGLQGQLNAADQQALLQAVNQVAQGQNQLQSQLDTVIQQGRNGQLAEKLGTIQTGQDALRAQTASLADQIETLQARKAGPFKAVKSARIELHVAIAKRRFESDTPYRYQSTVYPPMVQIEGRTWLVSNTQNIGLDWWVLTAAHQQGEITDLRYVAGPAGTGDTASRLTSSACVLQDEPRVAAVPVDGTLQNVHGLELAGDAILQADQRKLHVFKTTSAGLSFEVETSPVLEDGRYLIVKRNLRGIAAWFENPAYRPAPGDYLVTTDGKLVGIMVDHEKCFILTKERIASCTQSIPLADPNGFQEGISRLQGRR